MANWVAFCKNWTLFLVNELLLASSSILITSHIFNFYLWLSQMKPTTYFSFTTSYFCSKLIITFPFRMFITLLWCSDADNNFIPKTDTHVYRMIWTSLSGNSSKRSASYIFKAIFYLWALLPNLRACESILIMGLITAESWGIESEQTF